MSKQSIFTLGLLSLFLLTGCAPNMHLGSPVGVWQATGDDHGTLTIKEDGTFTITDASYNPIQYRDADDNFNASGTWAVPTTETELILWFDSATQGDFDVPGEGRRTSFTTGTISFTDPDEVIGIDFEIADHE